MLNNSPKATQAPMGFAEFVAITALMIALTALSIDIMLSALPDIASSYSVANANDQQLVIIVYMLGFAIGQPLHGPLSDRFGRKPLLLTGVVIFAIASLLAAFAPSFEWLLVARAVQGFGAAAPRVVAMAIVRDRFAGREMARVMSFVMMVFIIVPVIAPSLGELILMVTGWQMIFGALFITAVIAFAWTAIRLPETRGDNDRMSLNPTALWGALSKVVTTPATLGYTIATGFLYVGLMAYISAAQQVFVDVYDTGKLFPVLFGGVAAAISVSSLLNSRLVGKHGMHKVSHAALIGYVLSGLALAVLGYPEKPPLELFLIVVSLLFFFFGLMIPNFSALAMEPLGHVAGMGASFIGFLTTAMGAVGGGLIARAFDGSVRPLSIGFTAVGLLILATVLVTERGRLMRAGRGS